MEFRNVNRSAFEFLDGKILTFEQWTGIITKFFDKEMFKIIMCKIIS